MCVLSRLTCVKFSEGVNDDGAVFSFGSLDCDRDEMRKQIGIVLNTVSSSDCDYGVVVFEPEAVYVVSF